MVVFGLQFKKINRESRQVAENGGLSIAWRSPGLPSPSTIPCRGGVAQRPLGRRFVAFDVATGMDGIVMDGTKKARQRTAPAVQKKTIELHAFLGTIRH
jgi:hypothetical protein